MIRITNDLFESIRKITSPEVKTLSEETQVETTEEQIRSEEHTSELQSH